MSPNPPVLTRQANASCPTGGKCLLFQRGFPFDSPRSGSVIIGAVARLTFRMFSRRHAAWWTLVAGLCVTAALGWTLHREAVALDRQRLVRRADEIQTLLDAQLEKSEMLLQHLRDYLMLSGESRNPVFARWCHENGLTINCPWILGIAVATNRTEVNLRARLPEPPATWSEADWLNLCHLRFETPLDCHLALRSNVTNGHQFLPDYDLRCAYDNPADMPQSSSKTRLVSTIMESRLGMSQREAVMLDTNRAPVIGTMFYVPVYRPELAEYVAVPGKDGPHRCARWLHLSAMIVAPVDFKRLVGTLETEAADVGIEIFSSTNLLTADTWLNQDRATPRAGDPGFRAYLTHRQTWPMYAMKFSLFFHTTPLFEAQSPRRLAKTAAGAGLAVTLLATALVGVSVRARNRQDRLTRQIREARDALAAAQREREKIGRDLHDGTIQSLYAIQLGLGHTVEKIEAAPAHARSELSAVRREMDTVIAEIRQFITAGAEAERAVDFGAVLHALAQRARSGTAARIALHCDPGAVARLSEDQAVHLANLTREALSNALRHGRPQRVDIALREEAAAVVLEITDDGAGFEPAEIPPASAASPRGVGLTSMRARVQEVGATLEIQSAPGQGTRVVVRVPVPLAEIGETEAPGDPTDDL